jgi:hypothetical protein
MPAGMPFSRGVWAIMLMILATVACDSTVDTLSEEWDLASRASDALPGSTLMDRWRPLSLEERDEQIVQEVLSGNVPSWLRILRTLSLERVVDGEWVPVRIGVLPDYLAVGSDNDYVLVPMSPQAAQRIADATGMMLPTSTLVDEIWAQAEVKLAPLPIPPSSAMTTVPVFLQHDYRLGLQRDSLGVPDSAWKAGHKKDVVLTGRMNTQAGRVAIYGWHRTNGQPIQPLYTGHTDRWVDYSHGIRLVSRSILIDGEEADLKALLEDADRSSWFLGDGPMQEASYPIN